VHHACLNGSAAYWATTRAGGGAAAEPHEVTMTWWHVLLLALLQGITELFPVSSLGHTVILPGLLGWRETLHSPTFLPLLVMLHLGTATALLSFFWRDWVALLLGGVRVLRAGRFTPEVDPGGHGRQLALVVVGTIPAGLLGLLFEKPLARLFSAPLLVAVILIANGGVLWLVERRWQQRHAAKTQALAEVVPSGTIGADLSALTFRQAALIGLAQAGALLPGLSRSGLTLGTGLACGLSHEAAARFSFLLATPLIAAAGVLEVPVLLDAGPRTVLLALAGGVIAGVAAYLSVRYLMRYFATRRLEPFAAYCLLVGLGAGVFFLVHG
jgi:undecaprenyl-diphosphatase